MTTTKSTVEEYKRIMNQIDLSSQARSRILNTCLDALAPQARSFPKPAIAAISGAAMIAAAIGIRTLYHIYTRP